MDNPEPDGLDALDVVVRSLSLTTDSKTPIVIHIQASKMPGLNVALTAKNGQFLCEGLQKAINILAQDEAGDQPSEPFTHPDFPEPSLN